MTDKVEYFHRVNIDGHGVVVGAEDFKFTMTHEMEAKSTDSISTYCHSTSTQSHSSTTEEHLDLQLGLLEEFNISPG